MVLCRDFGYRWILGQRCRPAGERRSEREERHEGDLPLAAELEDGLVLSVEDAVGILDLANLDVVKCPLSRLDPDVGEPDQVELALLAEVLEHPELLLQRHARAVTITDS